MLEEECGAPLILLPACDGADIGEAFEAAI